MRINSTRESYIYARLLLKSKYKNNCFLNSVIVIITHRNSIREIQSNVFKVYPEKNNYVKSNYMVLYKYWYNQNNNAMKH